MTVQGIWVFVAGFVGGLLAEFVGVWALRKEEPDVWPAHYKRFRYYAISFAMSLVGGGLAVAYGMQMSVFLALNVGASAPLMIQSMLRNLPQPGKAVPPGARIG